MPENEFLRQKREREFQARVLVAVEKPKPARIIRIINAPFFLWLLTVIFVTVGGTYVTTYQRCHREANNDIEEYRRLTHEAMERDRHLDEVIRNAATIIEVRRGLVNHPYVYADYKERSTYQVRQQLSSLEYDLLRNTTAWPVIRKADEYDLGIEFVHVSKMGYLTGVFAGVFDNLFDSDLSDLKRLNLATSQLRYQRLWNTLAMKLAPNCAVSNVLRGAMTGTLDHKVKVERLDVFAKD